MGRNFKAPEVPSKGVGLDKSHGHRCAKISDHLGMYIWSATNSFPIIFFTAMKNRQDVENEELENFEEALRAVNTALLPTKVPDSVLKIISDSKCMALNNKSDDFWVMARGLKDFIDTQGGLLPVRGSIPDMFSDSDRYIQLSNIYRNQAAADAEIVYKSVQNHLESIGRSPVNANLQFLMKNI